MNIAIIQHVGIGSSTKKYAFLLPDNVMVGKGTLLLLDTKCGEEIGRLVDRVEADGGALDYILRELGTDVKHLRPVKCILFGKPFEELRAEHVSGRYVDGGEAYLRVCEERDQWKKKYIAANSDLSYESDRREAAECDLRAAQAKLVEVETERDMLKAKFKRILKCYGVGE